MPRTANPYFTADMGQYEPVGRGLTNLASVFAPPNALQGAQVDALGWNVKGKQDELLTSSRKREGQTRLGDIIAGFEQPGEGTPGTDLRSIMSTAVQSGALDVNDIGNLFRVMQGNFGGSDDARFGAAVGAGQAMGPTSAVSLDHQGRLLDRAQQAKPITRDQLAAMMYQQDPVTGAAAVRDLYPGSPGAQPDPWAQAERRSRLEGTVFNTVDAMLTDMGAPEGSMPTDLRTRIAEEAMTRIEQGESPRAAVGSLLQQHGVEWVDNNFFNIFAPNDHLRYNEPSAAAPAQVAPAPAGPSGRMRYNPATGQLEPAQ
jgi:hypothetical protein